MPPRPPSEAGGRTPRLPRLLLFGMSLGLALALAEGGLVMAGNIPEEPPSFPGDHIPSATMSGSGRVDAALGWKLAPGSTRDLTDEFDVAYTIGPDGWRETPGQDDGAPYTFVTVGDSFTFGTGVEDDETFTSLVAAAQPRWRGVNLGMAGFGVDQMWRALETYGVEQSPRLVVASFVLDDLDRSLEAYRYRNGWIPKPSFTIERGRLVERGPEHAPGRLVRTLRRTHLAELWRRISRKLELLTGLGPRWRLNRQLFEAMNATCRRHGAELVVVFIPYKQDWKPVPRLAAAFADMEVLFLDLGQEAVERPRDLFFGRDPHLNPAGHRFVAERLERFVTHTGLFDRHD